MTRWQRPGAREMLKVTLLLNVAALFLLRLSHLIVPWDDEMRFFLVAIFCIWRAYRGGRISRIILIIGSGWFYGEVVLSIARIWNPAITALTIIFFTQLALLASPSVYGHTRSVPIEIRAAGWAQIARRPPSWLLPWGLFLGMVLTLAYLGNVGVADVPGCRPATADTCNVLGMGYPLHWLTARHSTPAIGKHSLVRDCAQWVLACTSILYIAWNWLRPCPRLAQLKQP